MHFRKLRSDDDAARHPGASRSKVMRRGAAVALSVALGASAIAAPAVSAADRADSTVPTAASKSTKASGAVLTINAADWNFRSSASDVDAGNILGVIHAGQKADVNCYAVDAKGAVWLNANLWGGAAGVWVRADVGPTSVTPDVLIPACA